jgi:hypothetical protein
MGRGAGASTDLGGTPMSSLLASASDTLVSGSGSTYAGIDRYC